MTATRHCREPATVAPGGRCTPWPDRGGRLSRRRHQWRQGPRQAAWTACLAQGRCPAGLRYRGRVGRCAGWDDHRPIWSACLVNCRCVASISTCSNGHSIPRRHSGRALFGMLSMVSEFERSMIRDRVMAGLDRARSIWQAPGTAQDNTVHGAAYLPALDQGRGVRETARLLKVSPAKVSAIRRMSADLHP
jgi:hypothetical protein